MFYRYIITVLLIAAAVWNDCCFDAVGEPHSLPLISCSSRCKHKVHLNKHKCLMGFLNPFIDHCWNGNGAGAYANIYAQAQSILD